MQGPLTTVDLFSGAAGGWSLGLHRAGYQVVAAAEKDQWRRETFGRQWGVPVCADVREFGIDWYRNNVGHDRPFLVCGSPPCKEYSSANSKGGGLDSDDLFLEAVRITDELRPDWAAFENSPRVRTKGYDRIAREMEAIRFTLWPLVVGVANAGAAHRRARLFLLALNTDRDGQSRLPVNGQVARRVGEVHPDSYSAEHQERGAGAGRRRKPCAARSCGDDGAIPADTASSQGRASGQSRRPVGVGAHADSKPGLQQGRQHGHLHRQEKWADDRCLHRSAPADTNSHGLRIEQGRRIGPDGQDAPISFDTRAILGPVGSLPLGEHIRAYHGVSARISELCRAAYGDAVSPALTEIVGRAIRSAHQSFATPNPLPDPAGDA